MKTGYEILKELPKAFYALSTPEMAEIIDNIQKESYNKAIKDAVDNAKVIEKCEYNEVHQENYFEYVVDKDSILKLKIK